MDLFVQISLLLSLTAVVSLVLRVLKQPLIVAYIVSGIIAGPFLLNLINAESHTYETFSQIGISLLLFIIGLNLNFKHLKSIGKISLVAGFGQVFFTGSIGTVILLLLGQPLISSVYLAVAITFSSTIIIMKLLSDKRHTETIYGKYTIGLMLVQDLIALILIIGLSLTNTENTSLVAILSVLIKFAGSIVVLGLLSKYVIPNIMERIASSTELLFLFTLAWCFGVASLMHILGFSIEIGAVAAGISLSSSPYQFEIGSRIRPLRDFFLVLFFIVLGSEMSLASFGSVLAPSLVLSIFILIGNPLILYVLFRGQKFTRRNSFLSGLTAAQVSEFGFVLLFTGRASGLVTNSEVSIFTLVALITIFISSYLITYNEQVFQIISPLLDIFGKDKHIQNEIESKNHSVWVIGYHRVGNHIVNALIDMKEDVAVIDSDPKVTKHLSKENIPNRFGDVSDIEFLTELPLEKSQLVLMTIPDVSDQACVIQHIRNQGGSTVIIASAYYKEDENRLYELGADYVIMPHAIGAAWVSDILKAGINSDHLIKKLKTARV